MKLGAEEKVDVLVIFIGLFGFDIVLGVGGFSCGWVIEIFGLEVLGKIIMMLYCIVEVQKVGGVVAFIDVEHVLDLIYVKKLGVQVDDFFVL